MPEELIQVETDPAKVWFQGGTGHATALTHPLPGRVVDRPVEELEGDADSLDCAGDEEDRRAT